ncbi:MAG: pyrroline-5-carboxylate reductase [Clostridiales bacterium]|nr:pyrroline-5-carboxylate reductase [Clostridiales bacterium]
MIASLACIGVGHMAGAILTALLDTHAADPRTLALYDINPDALTRFTSKGVYAAASAPDAVSRADTVLLAVRPGQLPELLPTIAPLCKGRTVVSIAAGVSTAYLREQLPGAYVVRVMPNATMAVGRGAIAVARATDIPADRFQTVLEIFCAGGIVEVIPEASMNAVVAVNGSSPAYFYRIAAVIARFAKDNDIDPDAALRLAAKTMEGAAAVLLSGEQSPDALIRMVATPGGTTQAALDAFDENGFDDALTAGLIACRDRSARLGR